MSTEPITAEQAEERHGDEPRRFGVARADYWTEERKEEQRQKALEMRNTPHPDDPSRSMFGGRQPGAGRPRLRRASEIIAEQAAKDGNLMAQKLHAMLNHHSPMIQLQAINKLIEVEEKVDDRVAAEERELRRMNPEQLDLEFADIMVTFGVQVKPPPKKPDTTPQQLDSESGIVDAEVVDGSDDHD